jgi:hypothetical protein
VTARSTRCRLNQNTRVSRAAIRSGVKPWLSRLGGRGSFEARFKNSMPEIFASPVFENLVARDDDLGCGGGLLRTRAC